MATAVKRERQRGALNRLRTQLENGTKPKKGTLNETVELSEKDTKRIKKEIETLENRV